MHWIFTCISTSSLFLGENWKDGRAYTPSTFSHSNYMLKLKFTNLMLKFKYILINSITCLPLNKISIPRYTRHKISKKKCGISVAQNAPQRRLFFSPNANHTKPIKPVHARRVSLRYDPSNGRVTPPSTASRTSFASVHIHNTADS